MKCSITVVTELCREAKGDAADTVACKPESVDGSLQVPGQTVVILKRALMTAV